MRLHVTPPRPAAAPASAWRTTPHAHRVAHGRRLAPAQPRRPPAGTPARPARGPVPPAAKTVSLPAGAVVERLEVEYGGRKITLETGEIARQAGGAVTVTDGDTVLLATACAGAATGDGSFVPLQVHYSERFSAAGRTTGSFIKRDGRPKDGETLVARLVDRPIRPAIAKGWAADTQVLLWVLSYDGVHAPEPLAITAAGAALAVSDIPLVRAVAGARVARLPADTQFAPNDPPGTPSPCGGWLVANPTLAQAAASDLDLVVAGTASAVLMIEGYGSFIPDAVMAAAVGLGAATVATVAAAVDAWAAAVGKPKREERALSDTDLAAAVARAARAQLDAAFREPGLAKGDLSDRVDAARRAAAAAVGLDADTGLPAAVAPADASDSDGDDVRTAPPSEAAFMAAFKGVQSASMRAALLDTGLRSDGRSPTDVRPIAARAGVLPRTHGSALFTRGETQALAVTTLGSDVAAQRVDELGGGDDDRRRFYLQYFFPPCSVGETGRVGAPGRREIGHGTLAERALAPAVPDPTPDFPYTVRVESTITESNGSSSMASVCGGCLSMLDAGVPLTTPVAGVAMGLVLEPSDGNADASTDPRYIILTDILGSEDALGDMDFKVAGDADAITAFQMDIKVEGITLPIIDAALAAARSARRHILTAMDGASPPPRRALAPHAPRIVLVTVPVDKLGALIGPGGRTVRGVRDATGVDDIQVTDSDAGTVEICGPSDDAVAAAKAAVLAIVTDPVAGTVYANATIASVEKFGIIVEFTPGRSGLAHVSELPGGPAALAGYEVGDKIDVKLLEVGDGGRFKLSVKALTPGYVENDTTAPATPPPPPPEPGTVFRGARVNGVAAFGVFVDVGGRSGLVHVSELAPPKPRDPATRYAVDDEIDVVVLAVGADGKVSLSERRVDGDGAPGTPAAREGGRPPRAFD